MSETNESKVKEQIWVYHKRYAPKIIFVDELKSHEEKGWTTKRIIASNEIEDLRKEIEETKEYLAQLNLRLADAIEADEGYKVVKNGPKQEGNVLKK